MRAMVAVEAVRHCRLGGEEDWSSGMALGYDPDIMGLLGKDWKSARGGMVVQGCVKEWTEC